MSDINQGDNLFKQAIEKTPDVATGYCNGLKAIETIDKQSISITNISKLDGSLNIDKQTMTIYPEDPRWDYAIGYDGKVYFVEVHPANTSNIKEMANKKKWLIDWLRDKAPEMNALPSGAPKYIWAVTKAGIHISKQSIYAKQLAQLGLKPVRPAKIG